MKFNDLKYRIWSPEHGMEYLNLIELSQFLNKFTDEYNNKFEIMRSTQFTDKNGVEIFEGDVVKPNHTWAKWMDNWTISVKWNDKHSRFQYWNHDLDEWADGRDGKPYIIGGKYSEIIGNIYENPELLEGGE